MRTTSTGPNEISSAVSNAASGGMRATRRLVAVVVALLSVFAVSVAAPAGAAQQERVAGDAAGGSWSASDGAGSYAPAKGDPSIWPKPNIVQTNLSAAESQQRVEDCPLYNLCVRNQEADGLWSAYALYYCLEPGQYYELTNFTGTVYAQNSQDVTARFLRADNSVVDTIGPYTGKNIYWNPVWKIDPC
jgi:hypothetical protein